MNKLNLNLKYCHGISNLEYTFDLKKDYLIYAPNGTMKTSFSTTFEDYKNEIKSTDIYFPERKSIRSISDENNDPINLNNIVVVNNNDYSISDDTLTSLLINPKLKKEYDIIYSNLEKEYKNISKLLKLKTGVEIETLLNDLNVSSLIDIPLDILEDKNTIDKFSKIKYKDLFNDDNIKIISEKDISSLITNYIACCKNILSDNEIFVDNMFDVYNLKNIKKVLDSNGFFKVGHLLKLHQKQKNDFEDYDSNKIQTLIDNIDKIISENDEINKTNKLLTSKIKSHELNVFLSQNQWIIPLLDDIKKLKFEYWHYNLCDEEIMQQIKNYIKYFQINKENIENIKQKASAAENFKKWNDAIQTFNDKFPNMPFELKVKNITDIILNNEVCSLKYIFKDNEGVNSDVEPRLLKSNLSKGERKAFNILNLIFEIQYRKIQNIETIVVLDDIADSFDYKNKYAIIELIKELNDSNLFHLIILTHNFDFYRTCANRLSVQTKTIIKTNKIELVNFSFRKNIFSHFKDNIAKNEYFIASITFVRNIIEMTTNDEKDFNFLTKCLHYKNDTEQIKISDIDTIFQKYIYKQSQISDYKYFDFLINTADNIVPSDSIELQNKLVLSIACRLLFEKKLISRLNDSTFVNSINNKQTYKLIEECKNRKLLTPEEITIAEKVKIMVSENIHVNAFMYEPIIDMSDDELINLYKVVKSIK